MTARIKTHVRNVTIPPSYVTGAKISLPRHLQVELVTRNFPSMDVKWEILAPATTAPNEKHALHVTWEVANGVLRQANASHLIRGHALYRPTVFRMTNASELIPNLSVSRIPSPCGLFIH